MFLSMILGQLRFQYTAIPILVDSNAMAISLPRLRQMTTAASAAAVVTWYGDDPRFYHRAGGAPYGNRAWIDRFTEVNQNIAVCSTDNKLALNAGTYTVKWDCEAIFKRPTCAAPSANYPIFLAQAFGAEVADAPKVSWLSQVYVCANREDLVYRKGVFLDFKVLRRSSHITLSLTAYDDRRTSEPTSVNVKEVIVNKMSVYPFSLAERVEEKQEDCKDGLQSSGGESKAHHPNIQTRNFSTLIGMFGKRNRPYALKGQGALPMECYQLPTPGRSC